MDTGSAYVFINFEQAARFGHVGWGFQTAEQEFCFGSTDHLWRREYPQWHPVELLRYMNVQPELNNDFWSETGPLERMLFVMGHGHHIRYHAYKRLCVGAPEAERARALAQAQKDNGWNLLNNNCVHQVYSVLTKYGERGLPYPLALNLIPKVWFEGIESEVVPIP